VSALRVIRTSYPEDPAFDTAVSRALMLRVAAGEEPETLRIARPGRMVAFGKRDVVAPGYAEGVSAARVGGFEAIERLAGGRAAVFHEDTISFAHSIPDEDPRSHIEERFDATAELMAAAFRTLGIDARVGEVPGEYCPGDHSVSVAGERKLMGVGQRLVSGAAHVGGVVVVDRADLVRGILVPVYAALSLEWRPETTGDLVSEVPATTWDAVVEAMLAEYACHYELEEVEPGTEMVELARQLAPEHRSPERV